MKNFPHRFCIASISILLVTGIAVAESGLVTELGLDVWNFSNYQQSLSFSVERGRELDRQTRLLHSRVQIKEQVIEDLIHHRIDFTDAVAAFHQVHSEEPDTMAWLGNRYPQLSNERELFAQYVIDYANSWLRLAPLSEREEKMRRLRQEARRFLHGEGPMS